MGAIARPGRSSSAPPTRSSRSARSWPCPACARRCARPRRAGGRGQPDRRRPRAQGPDRRRSWLGRAAGGRCGHRRHLRRADRRAGRRRARRRASRCSRPTPSMLSTPRQRRCGRARDARRSPPPLRGSFAGAVRTFAILPVKRFEAAKQRLPQRAAAQRRAALWPRRCSPTCSTRCAACAALDARRCGHRRAVGAPPLAARRAAPSSSTTRPRRASRRAAPLGIARALERGGRARAARARATAPRSTRGELDGLLAAPRPRPASVIVPDRHGTGTNALLLAPPDVIAPSFGDGQPRAATARGARPPASSRVVEVASLGARRRHARRPRGAARRARARRGGAAAHPRALADLRRTPRSA